MDGTYEEGTDVVKRFWMGRRILEAYQRSYRQGERRICFLRITPDPVVQTYLVGRGIWQLKERMESGAGRVLIPPPSRTFASPS